MTLHLISSLDHRDPFRHAALEEYCLRNGQLPVPLMIIYINDPAVIIGRHQNGWQETNGQFLNTHGIPIVRRITGGGTVFHDPGNLNLALIADFDQLGLAAADPWVLAFAESLSGMGAAVRRTAENGLFLDDAKISGHARFTDTRRLIAHSSLLVSTDLAMLRNALPPTALPMQSQAVASRPSPVTNLADHLASPISTATAAERIRAEFDRRFGPIRSLALTRSDHEAIDALADSRFRTWEWTFGKSPPFEVDARPPMDGSDVVRLSVHQGRIRSIGFRNAGMPSPERTVLENRWLGTRFSWDWLFRDQVAG